MTLWGTLEEPNPFYFDGFWRAVAILVISVFWNKVERRPETF